ncbi:procollagen-lysine 5-dioxygenase [Aureococcus anophagefferens]|nr:procollagen-lysine 5-dioxygenase [Aureococcus anophagefferens]
MGAPRALMGLCRGPTLDTQLLKAAVAAEQGLPLHNSVGLTALHCLCENEAVTAAALEAVLPCGPRDLALARDRCATSPLDLLCRNGAVSVAMLEVVLAWCGPELVEDRCGSALHVLCAARCATAAALEEFRSPEYFKALCTRAPKGAFVAGATPLRTFCENEAASLDALQVVLNFTPSSVDEVDDAGAGPLHYLCANAATTPEMLRRFLAHCESIPSAIEAVDEDGWTPLHYLCRRPGASADLVRARRRGARRRGRGRRRGHGALHYLCWNERAEPGAVLALLDAAPDVAALRDAEGATPARYLAKTPSLCSFDLLKRVAARGVGDAKVDARLVELKDAAAAARVAELRDRVAATADAHAAAWRALAKQQLDRGECAECLRLFAEGAARCPGNVALAHRGATFALFAEETADRVAPGPFRRRGPGRSDVAPIGRRTTAATRSPSTGAPSPTRARAAASATPWRRRRRPPGSSGGAGATDHGLRRPRDGPAGARGATSALVVARGAGDAPVPGDLRGGGGARARLLLRPLRRGAMLRGDADHADESAVSLSVALNDAGDYDGGGLHVAAAGNVLDGPAGSVFCFPGAITHGGVAVTRGTRRILSLFLIADANRSGLPPGYTMHRGD